METVRRTVIPVAVAAGIICLLVYLRALSCGFVNFDDPDYVLNNTALRQMDAGLITWAFTTAHAGFWMPLTWISLALDYHFWGLDPVGYHLTNILLHAVNAGLVVIIADQLLRQEPGAGCREKHPNGYSAMLLLAGLFWGIHPLRVESVAWVTERKDVLNGVFTLGAIICYLCHARAREAGEKKASRAYLLSLALFALSLMAKSVSVVLPLMLLVVDWYPLGRLRRGKIVPLLVEKIPFLLLSAAMAVATIHFAGQSNILIPSSDLSLAQRLVLSGHAVFEYCRLLVYPAGIIHLYLIPIPIPAACAVKAAVVFAATCWCFYAGRRKPWLPAVWLCFLIPLLPVLAFFQNGVQAYAARFTYLPSVAASVMVAAGYRTLAGGERRTGRVLVTFAVAALLSGYAAMSVQLIGSWKNSETLWTRVINIQPIGRAFYFRGDHFLRTGNYRAAADDLTISIRLAENAGNPEVFNLYMLRGEAFGNMGRYEDAINDFTAAIKSYPEPNFYFHRALALQALGREVESAEDFRRAGTATGPIEWVHLW